MDVQGVLREQWEDEEVLEVVADAALRSAVEVELDAFVVGDQAGLQAELVAAFWDCQFAAGGDCGD